MGDLGLLPRLFPGVSGGALSREAAAMDLCLLHESLATQSSEAETALALQGRARASTGEASQAGTKLDRRGSSDETW